jgi:hypothetical protein
MKNEKRPSVRSLAPAGSYIHQTDFMMKHNYDPYRELVWRDIDPKEVTKKPSFWAMLRFTIFPKFRQ